MLCCKHAICVLPILPRKPAPGLGLLLPILRWPCLDTRFYWCIDGSFTPRQACVWHAVGESSISRGESSWIEDYCLNDGVYTTCLSDMGLGDRCVLVYRSPACTCRTPVCHTPVYVILRCVLVLEAWGAITDHNWGIPNTSENIQPIV